MKNREIIFPERSAQIKEVGSVQTFATREGDTMYGAEIVLSNGDSFSHWTMDRMKLAFFKEGAYLVYRLKKIIENEGTDKEKVKTKLDTFDFVLPRKVRAEMEMPKKIMDSISYSHSYACNMLSANSSIFIKEGKLDAKAFRKAVSEIASAVHDSNKAMLIAEDYGDATV